MGIFGRSLRGSVFVMTGVLIVGAAYQAAGERRDTRAYPPPGCLVDVGGFRLHIKCTGEKAGRRSDRH